MQTKSKQHEEMLMQGIKFDCGNFWRGITAVIAVPPGCHIYLEDDIQTHPFPPELSDYPIYKLKGEAWCLGFWLAMC